MKASRVLRLIFLVIGLASHVHAASTSPGRNRQPADPAKVQWRTDSAFTLLIEVYRLVHTHRIETDFSAREQAANALADAPARELALFEARQQREADLSRLETEVEAFLQGYLAARAVPDDSDAPVRPRASRSNPTASTIP